MGLVKWKSTKLSSIRFIALAILTIGSASTDALAADHRVSQQTSSFDCSAVEPGDTVTLAAGERGPLKVLDCNGASGKPIRILNDSGGSGPVVIRRTSGSAGGFVFNCINCVHVEIDGSPKWIGAPIGKTYGIKVTMTGGKSPSTFMHFSGMSRFLTVRNVEIDGAWPSLANDGIGIAVNDHSMKTASHPGIWREGILIENNYVHNVEGEGLYIGPNWGEGLEIPLRDIEIRNNLVEDTGWDGIQLKSAIRGSNKIHHNVVKRVGMRAEVEFGQHHGISIYEGTGSIYNNWVENVGQVGIHHHMQYLPASYGAQTCEIYNNVVVNTGQRVRDGGHGIASSNKDGAAVPLPKIYSNTIIGASAVGIRIGNLAVGGFVRDNIVADAPTAIAAPDVVSKANNRTGNTSIMGFINAVEADFRLRADSPARNTGSTDHPATDYLGIPRPQDSTADQGAFEFNVGSGQVKQPNPPILAVD